MDLKGLKGILPPLVTPFREDGEVDYDLFREQVRKIVETGVRGLAVGGSTGEGHTLTDEELGELISNARSVVGRNFPLIAGIITESSYQAVRRGRIAKNAGADALMVTPIHYLFNSGDQGNYEFFREVHKGTGMPVVVYNVVGWNVVSVGVMERLAEEGEIAAVKQSGGDIHGLGELLIRVRGIPIYTAIDDMMFPSFLMGASGAICAVNTLLPKTSVRLFRAVESGDLREARELHQALLPIVREVVLKPDMPSRIKAVMNRAGWKVGYARRPLLPPEETEGVARKVRELEG